MADKATRCNHRDRKVVRAYYDRNGAHRVKHSFTPCTNPPAEVDLYGLGYCTDHRDEGDYGFVGVADVDLDAVLDQLRRTR